MPWRENLEELGIKGEVGDLIHVTPWQSAMS